MAELRLEVREFTDLTRWRWVLTDAAGSFLADHEVRLDPGSWQFEAFADLRKYVSWQAAPDRYQDGQARIVAGVGAWAGAEVLGPSIADALAAEAANHPVTVRLVAPAEARELLFRPLELAHVHGRPLSRQDITLVTQTARARPAAPIGERLRILGLFSLPEGGQPLNLRRERHSLVGLTRRIAANGKAADIRILQYGVTRDRLRDLLEEGEGWDIIHISGHGSPGRILLETASGSPDLVTAAELAGLLYLARGRVKLVTVSACWSAADATAPATGALATQLAERLRCAVLAMRFPVADDFAAALSGGLYRRLADKGQPLPRALGETLRELGKDEYPALSLVAPTLFGERAIGLTLAAPPRPPAGSDYDVGLLKMAGFPPQADRFVGRTGVLARASAALAAESGQPGVLLHGMPGGGKTACALELACTHEDAFDRLVWYKAPDEGTATDGALTDFALALERCLDGFQMAHVLDDPGKLAGFLPRLAVLARERRLLIVVDNAESLLAEGGGWRDERWAWVIATLTGHAGLGRLILTSRRVPAGAFHAIAPDPSGAVPRASRVAGTPGLQAEAVGALSASEGRLLALELPNLRTLIRGELAGVEPDAARRLASRVLNVTRGHPKLLELADGQAADPKLLTSLVDSGEQALRDQGGAPEDYPRVLAAWTDAVTGSLTPGEHGLFWLLCCLEEPDRIHFVLTDDWSVLWTGAGHDGPADLDQSLAALAARGLLAIQPETEYGNETYLLHPGITAAGRAEAGQSFQSAVDTEAADFWREGSLFASGKTNDGIVNTRLAVRAGLAAVPYLLRQRRWADAAATLLDAFMLEPSRASAAVALPAAQQISRHIPREKLLVAMITRVLDPAAAEPVLRSELDDAAGRGDHAAASAAAADLFSLCCGTGRLAEALALAGQLTDHSRQAALGPWTQLLGEVFRLRVLNATGQASQVLRELPGLRDRVRDLPATPGPDELAHPWNVRELLLETGGLAALQLGQWEEALARNGELAAARRDRLAPAAEVAATRFINYFPLLRLGRAGEALDLLRNCRRVFERADDAGLLGRTLGALAIVENARGHGDAALLLHRDALRYSYRAGDTGVIGAGYRELGDTLLEYARQPARALACHLTAALIYALAGTGGGAGREDAAANGIRAAGVEPPANIADLCRRLGDIPGTDPGALIARLSPDPENAERTLRALIGRLNDYACGP